jgi:hypothetical protein
MQRLIEINASKDRDRLSLAMEASHGSIPITVNCWRKAGAYGRDANKAAVASRAGFFSNKKAALN